MVEQKTDTTELRDLVAELLEIFDRGGVVLHEPYYDEYTLASDPDFCRAVEILSLLKGKLNEA